MEAMVVDVKAVDLKVLPSVVCTLSVTGTVEVVEKTPGAVPGMSV